MRRIFIETIILDKQKLSQENQKYIKKVLKLKNNDEIIVFDGKIEAIAVIEDAFINIKKIISYAKLSETKLIIASIKKERFEWLVEKATELNIGEIFILKTKYSQINKLNMERLNKIAQSAARQSNRISLPIIHKEITLDIFLNNYNFKTIFGSLNTKNSKITNSPKGLIIGPEGGWSEYEEEILNKKSSPIKLSNNILRTETAAIIGIDKITEH